MPIRKSKRKYRGVVTKKTMGALTNTRGTRYRIMKPYYTFKNPTHFFKRTCNISNSANFSVGGQLGKPGDVLLLTATTGGGGGAMSYGSYAVFGTLDSLPDYTEFTTLFDRYKIVGMKLKLIPFNTQSEVGAAVSATYAQTGVIWHGITDYDDANSAPTATDVGINTLREYESYKVRNVLNGRPVTQYCKPRIATAAYGASVFTRFANMKNLWIDANSSDVQHYGFKGIFEMSPNSAAINTTIAIFIKAELTLYFCTKDLR